MSLSCTICGKRSYSDYCVVHKPRKPIPTYTKAKVVGVARPLKPINRVGKQSKKWLLTRRKWLDEHPFPLHICHYCGRKLGESEMTLDHKIPRSRAPELRFDFGNLVPACWTCNGLKGSVAHDDYKHECHL